MTYIIFFTVSILASIVGTICGVGGGVFTKPALDALNILPVNTITFLSTCTVIAMSAYNIISEAKNKKQQLIDWNLTTFLAIGSASGGIVGKSIYSSIKNTFPNPEIVGGYQAIALFIAILLTLIYAINKEKVKGMKLSNPLSLIILGFILGTVASFVGIGGGQMNIAVLFLFLSMSTKAAAANSIYMILISQSASLIMTFISHNAPKEILSFDLGIWCILIGMIICGIVSGKIGKSIQKRLSDQKVDKLFNILCVIIMLLCVYNALTKFNII